MSKTRFGSQGVILSGYRQKLKKNLMELASCDPPLHGNSIKNFLFVFLEYFPKGASLS